MATPLSEKDSEDKVAIANSSSTICDAGVLEKKQGVLKARAGEHKIGIVCRSTPFWFWAVTTLGQVIWIDRIEESDGTICETASEQWSSLLVPKKPQIIGSKRSSNGKMKPAWQNKTTHRLEDEKHWNKADIVFFDDVSPGPHHPVWAVQDGPKFVIWWKSRASAGPPSTLDYWKTAKLRLDHGILGGVTTNVDWMFISTRMCPKESTSRSFEEWWEGSIEPGLTSTTARGIVDPTLHGRPKSKIVGSAELLDRKLNWKVDRRQEHILPSVFSPTGFVSRKLGIRELALGLDFPAVLSKRATDSELERWIAKIGPPFKTRIQVAHLLRRFSEGVPSKVLSPERNSESDSKRSTTDQHYGMKEDDGEVVSPDDIDPSLIVVSNLEEREEDRNLKATKSDDASIPYHLWNDRILSHYSFETAPEVKKAIDALDTIRRGTLRYWKRVVAQDFWTWWRLHCKKMDDRERKASIESGLSALRHSALASWWDWDQGSSPFFWRMPDLTWMTEMRDGVKPMWTGPPPRYRIPQRPNPDPISLNLEKKKIGKVRQRGYIAPRPGILSLTSFFSVPKGTDDIRMVYDGTKSGLNHALHAPWFGLATVDTMLRTVEACTWSADNDFGEMFLNFWIHPEIRKYTGVDLTTLFPEEMEDENGTKGKRKWETWVRCAMGVTVSPYQTTQCSQRVKRIVFGCRTDPDNIFRWSEVRLNLPGNNDYDPSKPWICKLREDGRIAIDVHTYVDDLRETAPTQEEAWLAASTMAKGSAHFGLQDAARKRRPPSRSPGAWAGAVVETTDDAIYKTVSQERWDKTRNHIASLREWSKSEKEIDRKEQEKIRGFLVYVSLTYQSLVPYLKGVHLTLESWRPDRDEEGWRLKSKERNELLNDDEVRKIVQGPAPKTVRKARRFDDDVRAMSALTASEQPPKLLARPKKGASVVIIFGDASGEGFGSSLWVYGSEDVETEHGLWTREYGARSSNFRELYNLILRLESLVACGRLKQGTEIFMFTDNSTAEAAFYRGTSSTRLLFELVLRARKLEMNGNIFMRVVWVAGTRMISQGTDGLSRGDLMTGVMSGNSMLFYVPLNKSCEERQPGVVDWLIRTSGTGFWNLLDPQDWYDKGFERGRFVWAPPPAIADVAVDLLCDSNHIRPDNAHIFVCPALMSNRWRKKLGKVADFVFTIPVDCDIWSKEQHEPLIAAFVCPHLSSRPWQVSKANRVLDETRTALSQMWASGPPTDGRCLRKLWTYQGYE